MTHEATAAAGTVGWRARAFVFTQIGALLLAMYLGWVRAGIPGATLVGIVFILPSFLMVLGLAALYLEFGGLAWMRGAFYGIGAAVIAIIARSAYKLVRLTVARDWLLWVLFAVNAGLTAWTESDAPESITR